MLGFTATGFCGKIPTRGDFVGGGLPRSFTDPWDDWMQRMLATTRAMLGEGWVPTWLEGPVWRFALAPGLCGPNTVLGLWLPSVDRIGRYFPLTLAATAAGADLPELVAKAGGFLAAAETAGREALADDLPPEALARQIAAAIAAPQADPGVDPRHFPAAAGLWWSEGAPRVRPAVFACDALPDMPRFAAMLDDGAPR
jgi:type VI secretion system protein ImpM